MCFYEEFKLKNVRKFFVTKLKHASVAAFKAYEKINKKPLQNTVFKKRPRSTSRLSIKFDIYAARDTREPGHVPVNKVRILKRTLFP